MNFGSLFTAIWLALVQTVVADMGLHAAVHRSHLLVAPSFSGDGIELHPGLHPDHDTDDLIHLVPSHSHGLHWSQEGHRPALHGAKHAHMNITFKHPAVVLEHSSHVESLDCSDDTITICFASPEAMRAADQSWTAHHTLTLVTYHTGCGDESGRRRSFFEASSPVFNSDSACVALPATRVEERDAIDSGELRWGTFTDPSERKRDEPVKGHIRIDRSTVSLPPEGGIDMTSNSTALAEFVAIETLQVSGNETNGTTTGANGANSGGRGTFIITDEPDTITPVTGDDELEFISYDGTVPVAASRDLAVRARSDLAARSLDRRSLFSLIEGAVVWFVNLVVRIFRTIADVIVEVATVMAKLALLAADLMAVPFGFPFKRTYHNDISVSQFRGGHAGTKPPSLGNVGTGWGLAKSGKDYAVECVKCGLEAEIILQGELAFSMSEGITRGEISLENKKFMLHTIFGIEVNAKKAKPFPSIAKRLGAFPLSPLAIPGIFTLGPQVTISIAASLSLDGQAKLLIGGTTSISPGIARLSLVNRKRNKLQGFTPRFDPVAEATSGSLTAAAELGLPIGMEFGIDVLNGAFKKTVGLINTPSVYVSAQISTGEGHKCNNGVELRFGVKNRLYTETFGLHEYTIAETKIFETGLICISASGFDTDAVEKGANVFRDVAKAFGGPAKLASHTRPTVSNVAARLSSKTTGREGFRIIMDEKETSILVSGTDGGIYLVEKKKAYDMSAPWGSLNITEDIVNFDVLGRLIGFDKRHIKLFDNPALVLPLQLYDPKHTPSWAKVAALSVLKAHGKSYGTYGASISVSPGERIVLEPGGVHHAVEDKAVKRIYYTTACKIEGRGLRLYLTSQFITADGEARDTETGSTRRTRYTRHVFREFGTYIEDCRSVKLTSKLQGAAKKRALYP